MTDPDNTRQRLIRMETRLVKYQEANVQQLMGIHEALDRLCNAIDLLIQKESNNEQR